VLRPRWSEVRVGVQGAGKSTLLKLLIAELECSYGKVNRNGRLKVAYFAQHQVDALDLSVSPVAYLASRFPGHSEQEYRTQLGHFGITGLTGLQLMSTLSGGQKSRVAFAALSLLHPHLLILDEPTNHLFVLLSRLSAD
jgi:ATP-binding cassette subfamily F protein 3